MTAALRIAQFVMNRYPPVRSGIYVVAYGAGGLGLYGALAGERIPLRAMPMLGVVVTTLFADLLIMRVLDDVRDRDYDRVINPQRSVASGAVTLLDLSVLTAVCLAVIVAVNSSFSTGMLIVTAQLVYVAVLMALGHRYAAVRGDNPILGVLLSFPVQLLLYVYLFAAFHEIRAGAPTALVGGLGVLILTLCASQVEFGKKLVRRPPAGERSYTRSIGYVPTLLVTAGSGPVAVGLFAMAAHTSPLAKALVALPAIAVAGFAIWHFGRRENRWPAAVSTFGMTGTLFAFAAVGALG